MRARNTYWPAAACASTLVLHGRLTLAASETDRAADRFWAQLHSILPLIIGGAAAVALLVLALWVASRQKQRRRESAQEDSAHGTSETAGPDVSYREPVNPVSREEIEDMDAGNTRPYVANGHDYTDDVSRYTQQPGPEVNDVSRFTHGVGLDDEDDFHSLQNSRSTPPASRPSVGSRVERRRSAKKRRRR